MEYRSANEYALKHSEQEPTLLNEIYRFSHTRLLYGQMVSGHMQGRLLSMISHMIAPKNILEIGTFTGYSALCLAEGLSEDGHLDTIEWNDEIADIASSFISRSERNQQITIHVGDALDVIPKLTKTYDLVFLDGDKKQYEAYYEAVLPHTASGGFLLADNVLWYDKVWQEAPEHDLATHSIAAFNARASSDPRVRTVLLPIRDGLMMIRKI